MSSRFSRFVAWIKRTWNPPPPKLTEEEVLAIAQQQCKKRGWPFAAPVTVTWAGGAYHVLTFANMRGGNVRYTINGDTGEVTYAGFVRY